MAAIQTARDPRPALAAALAFVLGLATIAGAWGFQLIGGYVPCALCLEQRVPYYVGLPVIAVALVLSRLSPAGWAAKLLLVVAAVVFAYGAALGVYQSGAEWSFWAGPSDCGGGTAAVTSAGDLLNQMKATRVVSCTEASWRLLGLSFAGWNTVVSAAVALLCLVAALAPRRRSADL